jgi:hypothetical protein
MKEYTATIKWLDSQEMQDVIIKVGDVDENDDNIFFYFDSENEIEEFKTEGVNDFVIVDFLPNI